MANWATRPTKAAWGRCRCGQAIGARQIISLPEHLQSNGILAWIKAEGFMTNTDSHLSALSSPHRVVRIDS